MEQEINTLNVEIGVFLRKICAYTSRKDVRISNKTVALLYDAVSCIDKLVNTVKVTDDMMNEIGIEFLEKLDERYYELRQSIVCRMCIDSMPITKEDLEAHEKKVSHIFQARNMQAPQSTQNLSDSRSSQPTNDSYRRDSSRSVTTCDESIQDKYSLKVLNSLAMDSITEPNVKRNFETVLDTVDRAKREQLEERMRQEQSREKSEEQRRKEGSLDSVVDAAWKGVRVLESSDSDSSDSSSHGFNYDSKYLIEVLNLPASATRQEIRQFFSGISILNGIYGIHFVLEEKYRKSGRAFVQLENLKEYQTIHKFNMKRLDNRYIEVVMTGNVKTFKEMISQRKIPSKDRVVFVSGLPQEFNEQNIRLFFQGLPINRVHVVQSATATYSDCAYVKFSSMNDVEKAIKLSDKAISSIRIYRSTDQQMRYCYQGGSKRAFLPSLSSSDDDVNSPVNDRSKSRTNSKSHSEESKFLKVSGLPWTADKNYVYDLFPGLEIDRTNGIVLERYSKDRNTGNAFVEIKNAADYEIALKANLRDISWHLKVTKAIKAEFYLTKQANSS